MSSFTEFEQRIRRRLHELQAAGLNRALRAPTGIDLSSNDYLGLSTDARVKEAMATAVMREGCGATASRLLRGERDSFANVEKKFADFKKTESSLFFGSGYAANLGVLGAFIERTDLVYSDDKNHASIIDGIQLSKAKRIKFAHRDVNHLAQLLESAPHGPQKFVITESLFSMDGDVAPLTEYAALCKQTGAVLIVDEAHAVGIYGERGSGLIEEAGVGDSVFISINPAGKALGAAGAFVAGPDWAINYLINRARSFVFSTAPPPALASALDASLSIIQQEPERRERLFRNARMLRTLLNAQGNSQIIPFFLGENDRASSVAAELQKEGFDVRAIRPPTVPPGTARLRISVNATLDEATLRHFAKTLEACCAVCS